MRVDVVDEGKRGIGVAVVVLHRQLDRHFITFGVDVDDLLMQPLALVVQEFHHLAQAVLGEERVDFLLVLALVGERDGNALVQVRQLTHTAGENAVVEAQLGENFRIRLEPHRGAGLLLRHVAHFAQLGDGLAAREVDVVLLPVLLDPDLERFGERIHAAHTNTVQAAGDLVAVLVELAAGVQHRERQFNGRDTGFGVDLHGNSAPVVDNRDGIIAMNRDVDGGGVASHRLVDRVVDHFVDEMVQPT